MIIKQKTESPYAVHCHGAVSVGYKGCGQQFLTEDQYMAQLSRPDSLWKCPQCGCGGSFDEENYENHFDHA